MGLHNGVPVRNDVQLVALDESGRPVVSNVAELRVGGRDVRGPSKQASLAIPEKRSTQF